MKWLHLSDLHINDKVEWDVFKGDLIQHCKRKGTIDLVIVTGDYHDFREKNDFSKAEEFLIELMKNLNLDISKDLFLVPGNHDGSNPICEHKFGNVAALKKDPTRIKGKEWEELVGQFASYEEFVKNVIPGYSFEHPARESDKKQVIIRVKIFFIWNSFKLLYCMHKYRGCQNGQMKKHLLYAGA